jgi:hypothetical protein
MMVCHTKAISPSAAGPSANRVSPVGVSGDVDIWCAAQAHAQAHTDAQTATRAKAEKLAARAEAHGQAQAQAVEAAHRLKRVASMGAQQPVAPASSHRRHTADNGGCPSLMCCNANASSESVTKSDSS